MRQKIDDHKAAPLPEESSPIALESVSLLRSELHLTGWGIIALLVYIPLYKPIILLH